MSAIVENAVGGLIASEAHGIVTVVVSRIYEEIKLAREYKKEFQELYGTLDELNRLLQGPADSSLTDTTSVLSLWLKKVKDAAYKADDLLDEYSYEALMRGSRPRKRDKVIHYLMAYPVYRFGVIHEVKKLTKDLHKIYMDAQKYGIKPIKVATGNAYGHISGGSSRSNHEKQQRKMQDQRRWVDYNGLIGRDKDLSDLVKLLCDSSNKNRCLSIFGIVGLAGVGKTALSKRVAEEQEVERYFKYRICWLVVSHSCDLTDILKKMVEQLCGQASNQWESNSEAMVQRLQKKLSGKRYLLILDDVWDTIAWEPLSFALQKIGGCKGTTILVTSRDKNVLAKMRTHGDDCNKQATIQQAIIYEMEVLNKGDSWSLFKQRVGADKLAVKEKQELATRMVENCGGIPLAIRALGDLLYNLKVEKWGEVDENQLWHEYGILPSLKLSFIYLPSVALKKCFSYCAIFFGLDEVIQKDKLIQMWMGQGLLQPHENIVNMESVGEEYVDILLKRSLFDEAELDRFGNVMTFKIHQLVFSLAHSASGECMNSNFKNPPATEVRHLSTTDLLEKDQRLTPSFCAKLRTYYYYYPQFRHLEASKSLISFLEKSRWLRVLCLQRLGLDNLPKSVSGLKHLRYLDISQNCFRTLPDVITDLYHLQTLRIDYNCCCKLLCSLPLRKVSNLVNLRHFSAISVDIGILEGMGHLTALQTLSTINLNCNWGGRASELNRLENLKGTLGLTGLDAIRSEEEARSLNLVGKSNVDRLFLEWSTKQTPDCHPNLNGILKGLEPHGKLATLEVVHYNGSSFTDWLMVDGGSKVLSNLVSLTLRDCLYAVGDLKLENLRCLRFLSIERCNKLTISIPERGFDCCKMLESLKLNTCNVGNLPTLRPLTQLEYLEIEKCANITSSSSSELVGLDSLPRLTEVKTDRLLPTQLSKHSPVCESLHSLNLSLSPTQENAGITTLPYQLQHLSALQTLHISRFNSLEMLPDWIGKLTSLSSLNLTFMPNLRRLPSEDAVRRLANLKSLCIWECSLLKKQFSERSGEWLKISHIPSIITDDLEE